MTLVVTNPLERGQWRRDAACLGMDTEDFYDSELERERKQVCAGCPVIDVCLEDAVLKGDYDGVRGGLSGDERRALIRFARRAAA